MLPDRCDASQPEASQRLDSGAVFTWSRERGVVFLGDHCPIETHLIHLEQMLDNQKHAAGVAADLDLAGKRAKGFAVVVIDSFESIHVSRARGPLGVAGARDAVRRVQSLGNKR